STWLASTPPVYRLPQTWSVTETASNPAASAASTASASVGPSSGAPPAQLVIAMCMPSFTGCPLRRGASSYATRPVDRRQDPFLLSPPTPGGMARPTHVRPDSSPAPGVRAAPTG